MEDPNENDEGLKVKKIVKILNTNEMYEVYPVCPNADVVLVVAKLWPKAGGADVAGVPNGIPNPIAEIDINHNKSFQVFFSLHAY